MSTLTARQARPGRSAQAVPARRGALCTGPTAVWQWSHFGPPGRAGATDDPEHGGPAPATSAAGTSDDRTGRPHPSPLAGSAAVRTYSVLQLMPADPLHGVLAVGRAAHGFADEAAACSHALDLGWRGFAVLPSRHLPAALSAEVRRDNHYTPSPATVGGRAR